MSKFTKLPIPIEAVQLTERTEIHTREGTIFGYPGDWLITGIEGEQYPCGNEIFKKTYHPSGPDKCDFCKYGEMGDKKPCHTYEMCVFKWRD